METPFVGLPGIKLFPDGSFLRIPTPSQPPHASFLDGVASKDVLNVSQNGVSLPIFLPEFALRSRKLPIFVFFHGGGFVIGNNSSPTLNEFCENIAKNGHVIVVSVDYRLAPEHRLPAAFNDGFDLLKWLQGQAAMGSENSTAEPWLRAHGDYSACILMGISAGGALVHQVAVRALQADMEPVKLCGLILGVPWFGGEARTASERNLGGEGAFLTLEMTDMLWEFCLPEGSNREHAYCNVVKGSGAKLEGEGVPPVLVIVGELDLLHDRQMEYVESLKGSDLGRSPKHRPRRPTKGP